MLAASPYHGISNASTASRKRLNVADFPPAKRPKTASSASIPRTANSTIASQFEARRRRAAGWLGVQEPIQDNGHARPIGPATGTDTTRAELDGTAASATPNTQAPLNPAAKIGPTAPTPALLAQIDATHDHRNSRQASDDFRSVIDDLTIQNQKLKTKLRKYARLHSAHLQKEKLFEIKVHEGLPAHKKRELEETLRHFAASIDNDSTIPQSSDGLKLSATKASSALPNASSSSTSDSKFVDSAYASGSTSGNLLSQSHNGQTQTSKMRQDNKIKSYLDEIPETLYPSKSPTLSDQAKSKLVVRRLEQIFTGRGAAQHSHTHSQQQQEVSTAAAEHERSKLMAGGMRVWQEGTREAQILPQNTMIREDSTEEGSGSNRSHGSNDNAEHPQVDMSPSSPEQRPTRPLDLDIHRAQVPAENMEYIRHLAAPSPKEGSFIGDDNGGWVYLNLLVSMAQVHTVNVTPEFVRKAVQGYSQKMELSKDGTMIRWLGGTKGSRLSSTGDDGEGQWRSSESSGTVSKKGSTDELSSQDPSGQTQSSARRRSPQKGTSPMDGSADSSRFQYKPILLHRTSSAEEENSDFDSDSPPSTNSMEYATGINSSSNALQGPARLKGRKHDHGPIIFYHRAKFCTDLGGDPTLSGSNVAYNRFIEHPVGSPMPECMDSMDVCEQSSPTDSQDPSPTIPTRSALDLGDLATSISDCTSQSIAANPIDMEASGLGGIHPTDNFVVKVQTRHHPAKTSARKSPYGQRYHKLRVSNLSTIRDSRPSTTRPDQETPESPPVKAEIISAVHSDLPPSNLPPPSYGMPNNSTTESSSSDSDGPQSSLSSASARAARFNPRHMPHHINPSTAFRQSPMSNPSAVNKNTDSRGAFEKSAAHPLPRRSQHATPIQPRLLNNLSTSTEETKESSPSPSDGFDSDDDHEAAGKVAKSSSKQGITTNTAAVATTSTAATLHRKSAQVVNKPSDSDDIDDSDDSDDDDDSIDLLAHARMQDPAAVERQEREMRDWQLDQDADVALGGIGGDAGEESVSVAATGGDSDEESLLSSDDEDEDDNGADDGDEDAVADGRSIGSMSIERSV